MKSMIPGCRFNDAHVSFQVAKRLAMATNKKSKDNEGASTSKGKPNEATSSTQDEFTVGSYARATFEDGIDYEAKIQEIDESGKCLIKYVGYNNVQYVNKAHLLPSWGRVVRRQQKKDAELENASIKSDQNNGVVDFDNASMEAGTSRTTSSQPRQKNNNKKHNNRLLHQQTNIANFMNVNNHRLDDVSLMVPPPPPMPPQLGETAAESESLSAMLMAWYMSGYYTGLYQGQKMTQQSPFKTPRKQ
jgi:survival motor neuron protein